MKLLLICIFLSFSPFAWSQSVVVPRDSAGFASEKDIVKCSQPQKGLYRSFEEFRRNAPSITRDFELVSRKGNRKQEEGGFDIVLKDTLISPRIVHKEMWGFCTGKAVYVNAHNFQRGHGFYELLHIGRYSYVEGIDPMAAPTKKLSGTTASFASRTDHKVGYLLNLNNGKFYLLNQEALEKILSQDTALLQQFQQEDKRGDKATRRELMFRYVRLYNERHAQEIK
jgi:hypothetical protein